MQLACIQKTRHDGILGVPKQRRVVDRVQELQAQRREHRRLQQLHQAVNLRVLGV